ncbi:MAG: exodeoxyribonuclease VII large subunit, partial [Lachnospiraceae bacterium]|nr:exodeoxyribonuclease VII large subunit [Lachnospiraceae bacterium]
TGQYQLYAKQITPDGEGALYLKFEQLKKELLEMGMFDEQFKKPIPFYSRTVGIVTAPTGAAIRDIMNIAHRRNPYVQLILCPAQVQGEGAADSIVRAIRRLDARGVDVMIVGRGGGSIEDLWACNEEAVARAMF